VAPSPGYQIASCCSPGKRQRHRGILRSPAPVVSAIMINYLKAGRTDRRYYYRLATFLVREKELFFIISEQIALPIFLLRYVSHGAGSAQRALAANTGSFSSHGDKVEILSSQWRGP
ncbi:hypothetical protein K9B46_21915, partial [Klebsiella aerogenes]|uniref:hypothetical protein n=1 Tax=Klebsiella aerogenes TaxID=548 RepID=UPI001CBC4170